MIRLFIIYPKELKTQVHPITHTWKIIRVCSRQKLEVNEQKHWYIQTMKYYPVFKRNKPPSQKKTWKLSKHIKLKKQLEKAINDMTF